MLVGCDSKTETNYDINILCVDSTYSPAMVSAIQEKFPNAKLNISYYGGANATAYVEAATKAGQGPDIILTTEQPSTSFQKEYLMNLSNYDFSSNYKNYLINDLMVEDNMYLVPGSYVYTTFYYNKSLFDKKGWTVPTTETEFATLIGNMNTASITPLAVSGGDNEVLFQILSAFAHAEYFKTVDGNKWLAAYPTTEASSSEGFTAGFDLFYDVASKNAYSLDSYNIDAKEAFEQLIDEKVGMVFVSSDVASLEQLLKTNTDKTIRAMTVVGSTVENKVIPYRYNYYLAMNKSLASNDGKRAYVKNIMSYLTSDEGLLKISKNECDVSPSKTAIYNEWAVYSTIKTNAENGYVASQHNKQFDDIISTAEDFLYNVCFNSYTSKPFNSIDLKHREYVRSGNKSLVDVENDFTQAQTTQLMADIVFENANCDLALVSIGGEKNGIVNNTGVNGHLFAGSLDETNYDMCLPGSGYGHVQILYLSGAKIVELINEGKTITDGTNSATFDYYWSGINISLDDYGDVYYIRFKNDAAFEKTANSTYKVAMISNDYDASLIPNNTVIANVGNFRTMFNSYLQNPVKNVTTLKVSEEKYIRQ